MVDSMLPMQGTWVQSLVRELNPACHIKSPHTATSAATKTCKAKYIFKKKLVKEFPGSPVVKDSMLSLSRV